ncbi:MAG: nitrogenase [Candidatus Methanoperedenaceae archaeon]|nr:MAG: nitrogenase [Candidatus Methanoperedenaceae archaeon]
MHDVIDEKYDVHDHFRMDLTKNTCPSREERLGVAIKNYYGTMSNLVKGTRDKTITQPERCFEQSSSCSLSIIATRILTIRDSVTLMHAPIGCSVCNHGSHELFRHIPESDGRPGNFNLHNVSTNLTEKDIVYGGTEKLKNAIKESDVRYSPKAIFVMTSCASGIMGDDIEGAVSEIQSEVKAKIVPIHCEGFRSRVLQTGYDAMWHGILKYIVKKPEKKQKDLVNVTNMFSYTWRDKAEITRLLGKLGLRANFVPEFSSVEDLEQMSEAAVTAPICPTFGDYLIKGLEQEFGVPYFREFVPMGIKNTDNWLRHIAKYTGKEEEVEKLIEEEHATIAPKFENLKKEFEKIRKKLKKDDEKLTAIGAVGQGRVLAHAGFLTELGFDVTGACAVDYDALITDDFDSLIKDVGDFVILISTFQAADYVNLFHNLKPDLTLQAPFKGGKFETDKAMGTIHFLRGDNHASRTQAGYNGAIAYGEMCLRSFHNTSLGKLISDTTEDPYKAWWYEADPMYFVKDKPEKKEVKVPVIVGNKRKSHGK